jgi:hypothetical protein
LARLQEKSKKLDLMAVSTNQAQQTLTEVQLMNFPAHASVQIFSYKIQA